MLKNQSLYLDKKARLMHEMKMNSGSKALTVVQDHELSQIKANKEQIIASNGFIVEIMTPEQRRL